MQSSAPIENPTDGQGDVFFPCERCGTPLVVDRAAVGLTLNCQRCGGPTTVPHPSAAQGQAAGGSGSIVEKLEELRRHLKENESQRTEINGYINQLSIQLHRWQLRMQTLDERRKELTDDVTRCVIEASKFPG